MGMKHEPRTLDAQKYMVHFGTTSAYSSVRNLTYENWQEWVGLIIKLSHRD